MTDFYIYGASGHGKVVLDIARKSGLHISGFVDDDRSLKSFEGYEVLTAIPLAATCIVAIGDNAIREKIVSTTVCTLLTPLVHPKAVLAQNCIVGNGSVIAANAVINPNAIIKTNCIINTAAVIEHDCVLEDFVHVSPNATLCGSVTVGTGAHIGAAAVIIPGVKIGAWCTIGAGAVVITDVPDGATVVGNPGRILTQ
jgi:acetyltransferase EpsM